MNKIINDLYYGGINPSARKYYMSEEEDEIEYTEKYLLETLNDKGKEIFDKYKIACGNHESKIAYKNFSYGFKLASKMIFETLK